jgi:hypothetical protein
VAEPVKDQEFVDLLFQNCEDGVELSKSFCTFFHSIIRSCASILILILIFNILISLILKTICLKYLHKHRNGLVPSTGWHAGKTFLKVLLRYTTADRDE